MEYTIALCELLFQIHYPLGGLDSKESAGSAGDPGPILGSGRFPGEGNGYPLQYSCLGNPIDRASWLGYSPWGHNESDTTEQLTLQSLQISFSAVQKP